MLFRIGRHESAFNAWTLAKRHFFAVVTKAIKDASQIDSASVIFYLESLDSNWIGVPFPIV